MNCTSVYQIVPFTSKEIWYKDKFSSLIICFLLDTYTNSIIVPFLTIFIYLLLLIHVMNKDSEDKLPNTARKTLVNTFFHYNLIVIICYVRGYMILYIQYSWKLLRFSHKKKTHINKAGIKEWKQTYGAFIIGHICASS